MSVFNGSVQRFCEVFVLKQKQTGKTCLPLARRKGFEPLTYWFVASYSIQLSYRHIFSIKEYIPLMRICQAFFTNMFVFTSYNRDGHS